MRQTLSTFIAIALLVGLGALAVLALPNGQVALNPAPVAVAAQVAAGPEAILGANKYNVIAMPLNSQNQFSTAGLPYTADGLANLVGPSVQQVLRWDPTNQIYEFWLPADDDGVNFNLQTGGVYWLLVDSSAPTVVSFVGDVPSQGSISFALQGNASACLYNEISIPLDQSGISNADQLATAIGNVQQVLRWDANNQTYEFWLPQDQDGVNFPVKIGYPYTVCMLTSKTWPPAP